MPQSQPKEYARELIERMAPGQLSTVIDLMEMLVDPVARAIANAPVDDEPVSEQERSEIASARALSGNADVVSMEEVLSDYGLTMEDFERMGRTSLDPKGARQ